MQAGSQGASGRPGFTGPGVGPARGGVISRHPALPVLTQVYEPAFLVALLTTIRTASNLARRRYGPWNGPAMAVPLARI